MKKFYSVNSSARKFSFDICVNFKTILKWPVLKVSHYQTDNKGCKQKQPLEVFYKKSSLKNFLKCTGKPMDYSLFFNKIKLHQPAAISKRHSGAGVFSVNFGKFLTAPLQNTGFCIKHDGQK